MLRIATLCLAFSITLSAHAQQAQTPAAPDKSAVKKSASSKGQKATAAERPAPPPASGRCVGVMSDIEGFGVHHVGLTVFGNEYKEIPTKGWGLDELLVQRVRAGVGPGAAVIKIASPKGAFDSFSVANTLFADNKAKAAETVRKVAGSARCERYVVLTKASGQYQGNQAIGGIGIVNSGVAALSVTSVHAILQLSVHDGVTFAVVNNRVGLPERALRGFKWPDSPEAVDTPEVRAAARAMLVEMLDKALPVVLAP